MTKLTLNQYTLSCEHTHTHTHTHTLTHLYISWRCYNCPALEWWTHTVLWAHTHTLTHSPLHLLTVLQLSSPWMVDPHSPMSTHTHAHSLTSTSPDCVTTVQPLSGGPTLSYEHTHTHTYTHTHTHLYISWLCYNCPALEWRTHIVLWARVRHVERWWCGKLAVGYIR